MDLAPLRKGDIEVGKPLPWPVFDKDRHLLLREGYVIETQHQVDIMLASGLFRNREPARHYRSVATPVAAPEDEPVQQAESRLPLSALKLKSGEILQMQPFSENVQEKYPVRLIGQVEKRSIMVTAPVVNGAVLLLREGQPFVLRGFNGKQAYAFNVSVLRVCSTPFPYLHLSYPPFVQNTLIRQHNRVAVSIVASVSNSTDPQVAENQPCSMVDLSEKGAMLESRRDLGVAGDILTIAMRLRAEDFDQYLSLRGRIRSARNGSEGGAADVPHRFGVEFEDISATEKLIVQNFVYKQIID